MLEIYQILGLYKSIQLALINQKGRILLCLANRIDDIDFGKLKRRNADNGIYFIPMEKSNILFLDDLADRNIIPYQSLIIETSPEKYQAHIFTNTTMSPEARTKLQRQLVKDFNADPGATSGMQPRRLPGFENQKYQERPIVFIAKNTIGDHNIPILDIFKIESVYQKQGFAIRHYNSNPKKLKKSWNDFFAGDKSSADFRYALYLFRIGYTDGEIQGRLKSESLELFKRKHGHLKDYLNRTIRKVHLY